MVLLDIYVNLCYDFLCLFKPSLLFETHLSVYKPPYVSLILECTLVRVGNCHSSCSSLYI